MSTSPRHLVRYGICIAYLLANIPNVQAQEVDINSIHWAYSSYFGTGWYQVSGDRDTFVLRMTPRWELVEAELAQSGERTIGVNLRFPITVGLNRFDLNDLPGAANADNLASLSVTPGIDVTVPITDRWSLRPFASIGWGTLLDGADSAWTYWGGVKSRFTFQKGKLHWALLNSVTYVGYTPNHGHSENFWPLMVGLEFDYPLGNRKLDDEALYVSWHGTYTSFEDDLELALEDELVRPITDEWELGVSLRKKYKPIKIWWLNFDRLGLAYRFSSSGDFKGISFVFHSVFDR
jgi:hypothetical protein